MMHVDSMVGQNLPRLTHALLVLTQIGALANAAGVGGGAIYIPLFHVFVGFGEQTRHAPPLCHTHAVNHWPQFESYLIHAARCLIPANHMS